MKFNVRIFITVLIACILLLANADSFHAVGNGNDERLAMIQNESIAQLDRLQEYFYEGNREFNIYPDYELKYPNWYAGVYIDDDFKAVVVVTDTSSETINLIKSITKNEQITIERKRYSFNQMLDAIRNLWDYEDNPYDFTYHLDEMNNTVVVTIDATLTEADKNEAIASISAKAIITDVLTFRYGDAYVVPDLITRPGSGISNSTLNVGGSAGYRARHYTNSTYVYGFVSAGHVVGMGHNVTQSGSTTVVGTGSTIVHSNPYSGGSVPQHLKSKLLDINFIQNSGSHTASNQIRGLTTNHASYTGTVFQNMDVSMTGRYNSSSGKVTTTSTNNTNMRDYAIASYTRQNGDSGGIVYGANVPGAGHPVFGTHSGSTADGGWFSKAPNAEAIFGIYPN
ncbi:MAG: hypothetical protein LBD23_19255 [Oscillospiraceae bacterium]|jgi:hypothetical protein|nr:hypothetical protein [Oscillospiraceae bacterium]